MSLPTDPHLTPEQEDAIVLADLQAARTARYADILISFDKGRMEKCDITIKRRNETLRQLRTLKD